VKALLAAGADVHVVTRDGGTVFRYGTDRIAEWQQSAVARSAEDPPRWYMERIRSLEVVALLRQAGAKEAAGTR
jgi:hypothetical protein